MLKKPEFAVRARKFVRDWIADGVSRVIVSILFTEIREKPLALSGIVHY